MQANWVKQAVSAGGTGNVTLGAATAANFVTLDSAIGVGPTFEYAFEDGNDRETGIGHLSAATTLVRDVVRETLVSGTLTKSGATPINLTTSAILTLAPAAAGLVSAMPRTIGTSAAERRIILTPNQSLSSWSTDTPVGGYLYGFPVYWPGGRPITTLYSDITTAAAAGKVHRLGLAIPNDDWSACKVIGDTGNIAADSTGLKSGAIASPVSLPPGWYVGLLTQDGSAVFRTANQASWNDPFGWHATTGIYKIMRRYKAFTYGALPATVDLTTGTTIVNSGAVSNSFAMWASE